MPITLIHPANDATALELSTWCSRIISYLENGEGLSVTNLYAGLARRDNVTAALVNAYGVLFYGHGSDAELFGSSGPIIDIQNVGLAKGTIMMAIACSSAKILGPIAVRQGLTAYIGFRDRFVWVSRDPEGCFEAAINAGVSVVTRGGPVEKAVTAMRGAFAETVEYYLSGEGRASPNRAIGWLAAFWDGQHIEWHGQGSATLRDRDKFDPQQ
jgi:hypothetical protein